MAQVVTARRPKLDFMLHPAQQEIYQCPSPYKVAVAGRGWGKTRFAAIDTVLKGLEDVNWSGRVITPESEVMYMAPTFDQAKGIFWPIIKEVAEPVTEKVNENVGLLTLINGVRIRLKGMDNPDRARGFILRHAILDEFADMAPAAWDVITGPSVMKTNGTVLFIGTPKRGRPHFGNILHHAYNAPVHPKWGFPLWAGFQFKSTTNPWLERDAIAAQMANMSYEMMRQELEAEILDEGGNYLLPEWWKFDDREPADGFFVVAVDLGGFTPSPDIKGQKERRDDTAIAVVKIHRGGWWVKEIDYGRWDTRTTILKIVRAATKVDAHRVGIEKGALYNSIWQNLNDVMAQFGRYRKVEALTHGNQHKEDRIVTALEGRLQRGRITLNAPLPGEGEQPKWIDTLIKQASDFPSPHTHDDLVDALSYVAQLGQAVYHVYDPSKTDTWEPLDPIAGV
jgi:hypothetical protein